MLLIDFYQENYSQEINSVKHFYKTLDKKVLTSVVFV